MIDEIAIWTETLSATDLQSLFAEHLALSSFYRFNVGGSPVTSQLVKQDHGTTTVLAQAALTRVLAGEWHSIELEASGSTITARVNGETALSAMDSGEALPGGNIGLFSWTVTDGDAPGVTSFDDVTVDAPVESFAKNISFAVSATVSALAAAVDASSLRRSEQSSFLSESLDELVDVDLLVPTTMTTTAADVPFEFSQGATPIVKGSTASSGSITVTGTGFGLNPVPEMHIGLAKATMTSHSDIELVASIPAIPGGTHPVEVSTVQGTAHSTEKVFQPLRIDSVSPTSGSFNGGTDITLSGEGFSPNPVENQIKVCGIPCGVTSASTTAISCSTGSKLNVGKAHELLTVGVSDALDDAAELVSSGRMHTTKTTLTLPLEGSSSTMLSALRFSGVGVERGAAIHSARVQFQANLKLSPEHNPNPDPHPILHASPNPNPKFRDL